MKAKFIVPAIISSIIIQLSAFGQGSLTPPGAPGPTMVTLSQIEPRTPISVAPYTISQPGSYYLTTNVAVGAGIAITINANGVTLDLKGFTISSTAAAATGVAILLNGALTNITIYNGHIISGVTNSSSGTFAGGGFANGISGSSSLNVRVRDISVAGVLDAGISLSLNSSIVDACAVNVAGTYGITADTVSGSTVLSAGLGGIFCDVAYNCYGTAFQNGITTQYSAQNCYGQSNSNGYGVYCEGSAENCYGQSSSGTGIDAFITALNCYGLSNGSGDGIATSLAENCYGVSNGSGNEVGIVAASAENCYGVCEGSGEGIEVTYVASGCMGFSNTGVGVGAWLANGCAGSPTVSATHNVNSFNY